MYRTTDKNGKYTGPRLQSPIRYVTSLDIFSCKYHTDFINAKTIPIFNTSPTKYALVDPENYEQLKQHRWYLLKNHRTFYARRKVKINGVYKTIFMHREIMNVLPGIQIDHRDGNGLINIKVNLRVCNSLQNTRNRKKAHSKSNRYKGVSWFRPMSKWRSRIKIHGKEIVIGFFENEQEAAMAYDVKARELFGEFARLNFL